MPEVPRTERGRYSGATIRGLRGRTRTAGVPNSPTSFGSAGLICKVVVGGRPRALGHVDQVKVVGAALAGLAYRA